jgi:hypothetical protein
MLYKKIFVVYRENRIEYINTMCGQILDFINVT